jgi:hypothetical protein
LSSFYLSQLRQTRHFRSAETLRRVLDLFYIFMHHPGPVDSEPVGSQLSDRAGFESELPQIKHQFPEMGTPTLKTFTIITAFASLLIPPH